MKRFLLVLVVFLSAALPAYADVCGRLSDYQVREITFSKLPIEDALTQLTKGTPYQIMMDGGADLRVSASAVSGPLNVVLDAMAKSSGFTYTQDRCVLQVKPTKKAHIWSTRQGDDLLATLTEWANEAGWQVVFESRSHYSIGANLSAAGTFEEAIAALLEAVNRDARNLRATFYYGNQVLRITTVIEGELQK